MGRLEFLRFCRDAAILGQENMSLPELGAIFADAVDRERPGLLELLAPALGAAQGSQLRTGFSRWVSRGKLSFVQFRHVLGRLSWGLFGKEWAPYVGQAEPGAELGGITGEAMLHASLDDAAMEAAIARWDLMGTTLQEPGEINRNAKSQWHVLRQKVKTDTGECTLCLTELHLLPLAARLVQQSELVGDALSFYERLQALEHNTKAIAGAVVGDVLVSKLDTLTDPERLAGRPAGPTPAQLNAMALQQDQQDVLLMTDAPAYSHAVETVSWRKLVGVMSDLMYPEDGLNEDGQALEQLSRQRMTLNIGNGVEVLMIVVDLGSMLYVVYEVADENGVGWYTAADATSGVNTLAVFGFELLNNNLFEVMFVISCIVALLYPVMAFFGLKLAWAGKLGGSFEDEDKNASIMSPAFIFFAMLNFFSSALFFPVMKTFITAFYCYYPSSSEADQTIYHQKITSMQCWVWEGSNNAVEGYNQTHFYFIFPAVVGVLLYYPAASLVYPNLQFTDRTVDLKFQPTFLILLAQCKLVLSSVAVWLVDDPAALLITCIVLFAFLAWLVHRVQPCLLRIGDDFRWLTYMLALWVASISLLQLYLNERVVLGIIMVVGIFFMVVAGVLLLFWGKHPSDELFKPCGTIETETLASQTRLSAQASSEEDAAQVNMKALALKRDHHEEEEQESSPPEHREAAREVHTGHAEMLQQQHKEQHKEPQRHPEPVEMEVEVPAPKQEPEPEPDVEAPVEVAATESEPKPDPKEA
eukprot:TRINITY_DN22055_c0_g1_i1.p1 TRINITY_DN22055_c0_g1~~TRINITY_DN22055_c0_g1_i1.p1  ORF type:complete len:756 (-),score=273.91 TRINITY_DN22055_c0_g1_i1:27-2294(-)